MYPLYHSSCLVYCITTEVKTKRCSHDILSGMSHSSGETNKNSFASRYTSCLQMMHYGDVIMGVLASQITWPTIVYSKVYSGADQRKHQTSASLAFVRGIHRRPVNSPHKWPGTRKMFLFDDGIMGTRLQMYGLIMDRDNILTVNTIKMVVFTQFLISNNHIHFMKTVFFINRYFNFIPPATKD